MPSIYSLLHFFCTRGQSLVRSSVEDTWHKYSILPSLWVLLSAWFSYSSFFYPFPSVLDFLFLPTSHGFLSHKTKKPCNPFSDPTNLVISSVSSPVDPMLREESSGILENDWVWVNILTFDFRPVHTTNLNVTCSFNP